MESTQHQEPWNKGKLVGQKPPLKPKDIWAIRIQLQSAHQVRDLAMFNLAIDSKLRGCDLVNLTCSRHLARQPGFGACDGRAAKDATAGPVRADGAHQGRCRSVDRESEVEAGAVPVSQPPLQFAPCLDATVRPYRPSVACCRRARFDRLWHAHHAADQGNNQPSLDARPVAVYFHPRSPLQCELAAWVHTRGQATACLIRITSAPALSRSR